MTWIHTGDGQDVLVTTQPVCTPTGAGGRLADKTGTSYVGGTDVPTVYKDTNGDGIYDTLEKTYTEPTFLPPPIAIEGPRGPIPPGTTETEKERVVKIGEDGKPIVVSEREVERTYPDGTKVVIVGGTMPEDGCVTETTYPDGTKVTVTREEFGEVFDADGDGEISVDERGGYGPRTTTTTYSDGTVSTELPDGTKITTSPDGTLSTELPDGTTTTNHPDGSQSTQSDRGTTTSYPDGTKVIKTTSRGTTRTTTIYPDGRSTSVSENAVDGSITVNRRSAEGESETFHKSPSGTPTSSSGPWQQK
jgi:hypothetical protein